MQGKEHFDGCHYGWRVMTETELDQSCTDLPTCEGLSEIVFFYPRDHATLSLLTTCGTAIVLEALASH